MKNEKENIRADTIQNGIMDDEKVNVNPLFKAIHKMFHYCNSKTIHDVSIF